MAISWLAVLRLLPWTEIIRNAPQVADGAKKLWNAVGKKTPASNLPDENTPTELSAEALTIATLQAQLAQIEAQVADLHEQMLASTELIKALAEQNAQLIKHVEANRTKILWLAGAVIVAVIAAVAALV